jgi:uncharacterized protein (DUF885 family)
MNSRRLLWLLALMALTLAARREACGDAGDAGRQLSQLIDEMWEWSMRENPLFATSAGDHRFDDKLPKVSVGDSRRRHEKDREFLERLEAIERDELSANERVNYDILGRQLRDDIAEFKFQSYLIPITNRSGLHIEFPELRREAPLATTEDFENYIARLRAFEEYSTGHIEVLRAGIEAEKTLPAEILGGWEPTVEAHIVEDPKRSLLFEPLEKLPASVPESEHDRLREAARTAIKEGIVPGYRRFRDFMRDEYVPSARGSIGASALPDGRDFYRHRVRRFTTLDLTPEEVHQVGLSEVKRIRGEMDDVIRRVEFDGDFKEFVEHLRTDPKFYADTPAGLMKECAAILKRIDGELPLLFGRLPRMPYGLRPVPDYIAPRTTSAYYQRPTGD